MNRKGAALVICFMVIAVLTILGAAILSASMSENSIAKRLSESTQAFWLAEAGVNQALDGLRSNYDLTNINSTALGAGGYSATIAANADETRTVTAQGFIPFIPPFCTTRVIVVTMNKLSVTPTNFYDNALYSSANISISGNSYDVEGNVIYAGTITSNTGNIDGTITRDPAIAPLASLSYDQLRAISKSQDNYHDASELKGPFPDSFWYDESLGIPNVVFLEGNFDLKGNDVVGGFFVVGGEVTYDAVLSGNVTVKGCIYARGTFTVNGGGNALNVDGGIWTGSGATLNGHVKISYNDVYMNAIKGLNIDTDVQVNSWQDTQNPYTL
jgi:Tfp pilus assembly protein PilX